jgi:hypothetical protein
MGEMIKKTINGHKYEIGYLPAMKNTNLFIKFSSYIGGSLPDFLAVINDAIGNKTTNTLESKVDLSAIGEGINKIMKSLYINDPEGHIILEIMCQTLRDGRTINENTFNEFYTGNISEMVEALYESIMVHFKPFLPIDKLAGDHTKKEKIVPSSAEI